MHSQRSLRRVSMESPLSRKAWRILCKWRLYGDCAATELRLHCELIRSGIAVKVAKV